jgi:hypothetical protein
VSLFFHAVPYRILGTRTPAIDRMKFSMLPDWLCEPIPEFERWRAL